MSSHSNGAGVQCLATNKLFGESGAYFKWFREENPLCRNASIWLIRGISRKKRFSRMIGAGCCISRMTRKTSLCWSVRGAGGFRVIPGSPSVYRATRVGSHHLYILHGSTSMNLITILRRNQN